METENLVITRENYQGYLELFELRINKKLTEEYQEYNENEMCYIGLEAMIEVMGFVKILCEKTSISDESKQLFEKQNDQFKNLYQNIKRLQIKYPTLDYNLETLELEKALLRIKFLERQVDLDKVKYKVNYEILNKYLNAKETIENTLLYGVHEYKFISPCTTISHVKIKKR